MFCLFFTPGPVHNLDDAKKSDVARFGRFFHALLSQGIYLAPSQFETGFISCAHSPADIETTARTMTQALRA
jgi:glutamate-1-semialdehyde 2,1-aminomutase